MRPAAFEAALASVTDTAILVSDIAQDDATTLEDLVELLGAVHDAQAVLGAVWAVVASEVYPALPIKGDEGYPIPSGGVVKSSLGTSRKRFDQPMVISDLCAGIVRVELEAAGVGIVDSDGMRQDHAVTHRIVSAVVAATGATAPSFDSWRSGITKKYGVDLNRHCEWERGNPRVWIEGRADATG